MPTTPIKIFLHLPVLLLVLFPVADAALGSYRRVKSLPGFSGPLPFELETGYVGVGNSEEFKLFYYFINSDSNPKTDPLILWLTGGPRCSAFSGLAFEAGPISFKGQVYNGSLPQPMFNPYSWTKKSSIIFLDLPVGTGFSYATTSEIPKPGDFSQIHHATQFLRKWLVDHPEFISNPFYVAGNSYSGMIVPVVAQKIVEGNKHILPFINFQGYILGNPITSAPYLNKNFQIPFAHNMALISNELFEEYEYLLAYYWINNDQVRKSLHIHEGSIGEWVRCKDNGYYDYELSSVFPYHVNLSSKGYRSLIYSGDHDMKVPNIQTQAWIKSLNYSIVDDWRPWFIEDQVVGFTRSYANKMTFATIKGGGHTPQYTRKECSVLFNRWILGESL